MASQQKVDYDSIVIGAGFAGLSLIHHLREAGQSVKVFDRAADIGGTWTWNRYPGAMTDSESYYYCLTFSKELLQEWSWTQRFPDWEETHSYMHFVADKCDMWPHIQLNTEVISADYQQDAGHWRVTTGDGKTHTCKYFISGMGMISEPVIPKTKGMDNFKGPLFHSSRWPQEGLDFAGKRVAIIGAGATTVQMLPVVSQTAASVTVFHRTPNFILPAMQKQMTPEWEKEIKDGYDEIVENCRNHAFGMDFTTAGRNLADTPADEIQQIFEENWNGSFRWVFETFDDLLSNPDANKMARQFVIDKMRERIADPKIADILVPAIDDYALFAKRPPLDHSYLEAYARDNVQLVDIKNREPIVEITETGIRTTENEFGFDIIVLCTGFRAYTGALEAFPIRGASGQSLGEKWQDNSNCIMGVCTADFPNLFMVTGPQAPFANIPTSIEQNAMWIADCIKKMESEGFDVFKPKKDAEDEWSAHVSEVHQQTLLNDGDKVNSWMMGANIEGHTPRVLIYFGGASVYYDKLRESVDAGFPELEFERNAS